MVAFVLGYKFGKQYFYLIMLQIAGIDLFRKLTNYVSNFNIHLMNLFKKKEPQTVQVKGIDLICPFVPASFSGLGKRN